MRRISGQSVPPAMRQMLRPLWKRPRGRRPTRSGQRRRVTLRRSPPASPLRPSTSDSRSNAQESPIRFTSVRRTTLEPAPRQRTLHPRSACRRRAPVAGQGSRLGPARKTMHGRQPNQPKSAILIGMEMWDGGAGVLRHVFAGPVVVHHPANPLRELVHRRRNLAGQRQNGTAPEPALPRGLPRRRQSSGLHPRRHAQPSRSY